MEFLLYTFIQFFFFLKKKYIRRRWSSYFFSLPDVANIFHIFSFFHVPFFYFLLNLRVVLSKKMYFVYKNQKKRYSRRTRNWRVFVCVCLCRMNESKGGIRKKVPLQIRPLLRRVFFFFLRYSEVTEWTRIFFLELKNILAFWLLSSSWCIFSEDIFPKIRRLSEKIHFPVLSDIAFPRCSLLLFTLRIRWSKWRNAYLNNFFFSFRFYITSAQSSSLPTSRQNVSSFRFCSVVIFIRRKIRFHIFAIEEVLYSAEDLERIGIRPTIFIL